MCWVETQRLKGVVTYSPCTDAFTIALLAADLLLQRYCWFPFLFFCVFFFLVAVMLSQYTWSLVPIKPIELNCDLNMTEMNPSEQEYTV